MLTTLNEVLNDRSWFADGRSQTNRPVILIMMGVASFLNTGVIRAPFQQFGRSEGAKDLLNRMDKVLVQRHSSS